MTPLAITLLVIKIFTILIVAIYPAFEVAKATREVLVKYVYPIRKRETIISVLVLSLLAAAVVCIEFTFPLSMSIYGYITGI